MPDLHNNLKKSLQIKILDGYTSKLARSGLSARDGKTLQIKELTAQQVSALSTSFSKLTALFIPYHDSDGKSTGFFRIRYMEKPASFSNMSRWHKYAQPPGTTAEIYLPRNVDGVWAKIFADVGVPLFITEGELKAAAGCKNGYPTIGLGGVYSFRSRKQVCTMIPSLERCAWEHRSVMLVFDSDAATNPHVMLALQHLADELTSRGAVPFFVTLPALGDNDKTGLDDYLLAEGKEGFDKLLNSAEPFAAAKALWRMNVEFACVDEPGVVIEISTGRMFSANNFTNFVAANRYFDTVKDDKLVKKQLAPEWVKWPYRKQLSKVVYAPGELRITEDGEYNLWTGWGIEPAKGTLKPWHELLDYVFNGAVKQRQWFERWCAYPLQNPGAKLYTSVLMWGVNQGTGKSLIGYTLGRIYGQNFREIHQADLLASRNTWSDGCQFALGDEVVGSDRRADTDRLKGLITQQEVLINKKYVPEYTIKDRTNYYFTSQHPGAFFLDDQDRRFFIHELDQPPMPDEFYTRYDEWYRSPTGAAALFYYLTRLDLSSFNPRACALTSPAREAMIDDARSDLGSWVAMLKRDPDSVLRLNGQALPSDLWTNAQLLALYDPERRTRVTANGLGRELKRAGIPRFVSTIKTKVLGTQRIYIVRKSEQWLRAQPRAIATHLEQHFGTHVASANY